MPRRTPRPLSFAAALALGAARAPAAEVGAAFEHGAALTSAADSDLAADGESTLGWSALGPAGSPRGAPPPRRTRGLSLGVRASAAFSPGERQRWLGVLELSVGLDDWLGGRVAGAGTLDAAEARLDGSDGGDGDDGGDAEPGRGLRMPPAEARALAEPGRGPLAPPPAAALAEPSGAARAVPAPGAPPHAGAGPSAHAELGAARLARAVVAEALRVRGSAAELRRLDGMASRSRAAASLPEVRLGAGTARDQSLRLSPTVDDPARFTRDGGRDTWVEARLIWRLDSAIFAHDELAIMRLRAQHHEESARLAREVLEALVDWRKAHLVRASPLAAPEEREAAELRQFGAVARLDVLTAGWFSRYLERWSPAGGAAPWP